MRVGTKSWAISDPGACVVNVELVDTPRGVSLTLLFRAPDAGRQSRASRCPQIPCALLPPAVFALLFCVLRQFANSAAGNEFWQGTRAVIVCVDGQSRSCHGVASRWLTGPVIAECRKHSPNAIICLLATKADSYSERRAQIIDTEMQSFVERNLCSTWAKVSAKEMTGKLPVNSSAASRLPRKKLSPRFTFRLKRLFSNSRYLQGASCGSLSVGIYDKADFLKQLLYALVTQDLKAHKNRVRRSIKARASVVEPDRASATGRASISQRASVMGAQLKEVAVRYSLASETS